MASGRDGRRGSKKSVLLGEFGIATHEKYEGLGVDSRAEMIRALISLGLTEVGRELDAEVTTLSQDQQLSLRQSAGRGQEALTG